MIRGRSSRPIIRSETRERGKLLRRRAAKTSSFNASVRPSWFVITGSLPPPLPSLVNQVRNFRAPLESPSPTFIIIYLYTRAFVCVLMRVCDLENVVFELSFSNFEPVLPCELKGAGCRALCFEKENKKKRKKEKRKEECFVRVSMESLR